MKDHFTIAELHAARCPGLPGSLRGLYVRAEQWRAEGHARRVRGGWEYPIEVLPPAAQVRLSVLHAPANDDRDGDAERSKALWARFEALPAERKAECARRLAVLDAAEVGRAAGLSEVAAVARAAREHGVAARTVHRWRKAIAGLDRADWLPALAPAYRGKNERATCHRQAWEALKSDYLRPEAPTFSSCYRRVKRAAAEHGWTPLPGERALRRRFEAEVPEAVRTLAREGRDTAKALYPAQRRTRDHLHAMQAVNMDGHKLDVFVRFPDGRIGRAHLIALQDLHSGKLVGWRLAESENKVSVRLAIGDMVERFGIPDAIYLDNGRAFASKWITGGAPNRFRFKVRDEDPRGLLTALGIEVHWTTPYSGQSKPIERAFRDLADAIARHPACAGAYTGNKPDAKPENYGSKAVPFELLRALVDAEVAEHNARAGRTGGVANGRSFDEVFAASMADTGTVVRWPTSAQRSLWLLAAERIRTRRGSGEIHLFGNRYWDAALNPIAGMAVTVRFDPDDLTRPLKVYDARDRLICEAERVADTGFDDVAAAREHAARRNALLKATREQERLHRELTAEQLADIYGAPTPAAPEPVEPAVKKIAVGDHHRTWDDAADDAFSRAIAGLRNDNVLDFPAASAAGTTGRNVRGTAQTKRGGIAPRPSKPGPEDGA